MKGLSIYSEKTHCIKYSDQLISTNEFCISTSFVSLHYTTYNLAQNIHWLCSFSLIVADISSPRTERLKETTVCYTRRNRVSLARNLSSLLCLKSSQMSTSFSYYSVGSYEILLVSHLLYTLLEDWPCWSQQSTGTTLWIAVTQKCALFHQISKIWA